MGTKLVHRPARLAPDPLPAEPLRLAKVPVIDATSQGASALRALLPLMAGLGMLAMMLSSGNPIRMIAGGVIVAAAVIGGIGMYVYAKTGGRKRAEQQRGLFIDYVTTTRHELDSEIEDQRRLSHRRHPAPSDLLAIIRDPSRLWERRPTDPDFLTVRIGSGVGPLAREVDIDKDNDPLKVVEPISQAHLDRLVAATERIDNLPIGVPLAGIVSIVGPADRTYEVVRAMLVQTGALHAPDDVRVHIALPAAGRTDAYAWALWFPHLLDPERFDGPIGRRMASAGTDDLDSLRDEVQFRRDELADTNKRYTSERQVDRHHLLVVVDADDSHGRDVLAHFTADELRALRITLIVLNEDRTLEPGHVDTRVIVSEDGTVDVDVVTEAEQSRGYGKEAEIARTRRLVRGASRGAVDRVSDVLAGAIARRLAPIRLVDDATPDAPLETTITLDRILGIGDFGTYNIDDVWAPRPLDAFLNVPFGVDSGGAPVHLNLKESAQEGMGPHGLCIGATGSGKSEVLRTLVLAQAVCHSPDRLTFVLVDYKGGAAFAGLDKLPHTTAMVDNLSDDAGLVDRLHDALLGEMQRRQQVLQAAGSLPNVTEYNRRRDAGQDLEPLPNLLVVIDEFGEILTAKPDFIDLFVQIGRIGRSIGVHLLLATQRLEESKLRGLESHLSYRIGLRTFSAQESRTVIGTTDAHELPPIPGSGILKVDPDIFIRFKSAYVSGPYVPQEESEDTTLPPVPMPFRIVNDTADWLTERQNEYAAAVRGDRPQQVNDDPFSASTLEMVAERLGKNAPKVRQIWLPPLPDALRFGDVLGRLQTVRSRGLTTAAHGHHGTLEIPLGLKDKPLRQWQGPLTVDLSGSGGHIAFLGSPQSGKTTALRSLIVGAALTHTPAEVSFYLIDMSGSGLRPMSALPHVGDVATRFETDKIRRTIAEITTMLAERERIFADHRIETVDQMRDMHRAGGLPELRCADVFLVIDGWWTFREEYDELGRTVQEIASRGLAYGIHLAASTGRWADFRVQMQAMIGTRVELRLNDPLDSTIARRVVETIRADTPGRCLTQDQLLGQIALPTFGGDLGSSEETFAAIAAGWPGPAAPPVRMLPDMVTRADLRREHPSMPSIAIGVSESDLMPVRVNLFGDDPHLLVFGDSGSGKTALARTVVDDLCPNFREGELVFAVMDLKRQLLDVVPSEFMGGYAGTANVAAGLVASIVKELQRRLPPDDVTPRQLRERSWWTGPEVVIIADDYDLMEGSNSPLRPLVPFLPQAHDLGLHLVVMRRSGGASRSMYEAVIQALKEGGATGLLLSGDRQEGQIWPKAWMSHLPPGRGDLIRRGRSPERIQVSYTPPRNDDADE